MKRIFNKNQKLGEIAAIFPKATSTFMKYDIDFCCGGDRTLDVALREKGLDINTILSELDNAYEEYSAIKHDDIDWRNASYSTLIDFIINKHHAFMKKELPLIDTLVNKILKVHFVDSGEVLTKVHKLFGQLKAEIEMHLIKEEEILFPLIIEYEKSPSAELLNKVINVMNETEDEHDAAGDILKELRRVTNQYEVPPTGCNSFKLTYEKLMDVEADLFHHIHLENNIMFERLKASQAQ